MNEIVKYKLNYKIAEFMGLKNGVDFGFMCGNYEKCNYCYRNELDYRTDEDGEPISHCYSSYISIPDYTAAEDWVKVVEKLTSLIRNNLYGLFIGKHKVGILRTYRDEEYWLIKITAKEFADDKETFTDKELREAVCYIAVEYFKNYNQKKQDSFKLNCKDCCEDDIEDRNDFCKDCVNYSKFQPNLDIINTLNNIGDKND
jgi:hypothetical protein